MSGLDDYDRARANVDRLMEQVGRSISAYEDVDVVDSTPTGTVQVPVGVEEEEDLDLSTYQSVMSGIPSLGQVADPEPEQEAASTQPSWIRETPHDFGEETEDELLSGHVPVDPQIRCPHCQKDIPYSDLLTGNQQLPISDEYFEQGTVGSAGELNQVWDAFVEADELDQECTVELDTGTYELQGSNDRGFTLLDTAKEYFYVAENGRHGELCDVSPDALFIWILRNDDRDGEALGYILDGWLFIRKGVL